MLQLLLGLSASALAAGCSPSSTNTTGHDQHGQRAHSHQSSRQHDVAARGKPVMRFNLDRTTHHFTNTDDGGVLKVVSDVADRSQVEIIRSHLRMQAAAFSRGDYSAPANIHGADMPGLAELSANARAVRVIYEDVRDGARLRFTTNDRGLVAAMHRWFAAQRSDHGSHAAPKLSGVGVLGGLALRSRLRRRHLREPKG